MFKNHNDLNIDDSDIVQIEENRKKEKSGNQIMIKKIDKNSYVSFPYFLSANFHTYFNTISIMSNTKEYFHISYGLFKNQSIFFAYSCGI